MCPRLNKWLRKRQARGQEDAAAEPSADQRLANKPSPLLKRKMAHGLRRGAASWHWRSCKARRTNEVCQSVCAGKKLAIGAALELSDQDRKIAI